MRRDVLTPFEHALMGSNVLDRYENEPHIPLAVQDRTLSVEECDTVRQQFRRFGVYVMFYDADGNIGQATLEKLDTNPFSINYRRTVKDAVLKTADRVALSLRKKENIKYWRDGPRVELGQEVPSKLQQIVKFK